MRAHLCVGGAPSPGGLWLRLRTSVRRQGVSGVRLCVAGGSPCRCEGGGEVIACPGTCAYEREVAHKRVRAFTLPPACHHHVSLTHLHPFHHLQSQSGATGMAGGVAVLGPGGSVALARSGTGESGARAEPEKVNTGPPSSVRFRHPARIPVAQGPCQLREGASEQQCPPCPRPHPHPKLEGTDQRTRDRGAPGRGVRGVTRVCKHVCV